MKASIMFSKISVLVKCVFLYNSFELKAKKVDIFIIINLVTLTD